MEKAIERIKELNDLPLHPYNNRCKKGWKEALEAVQELITRDINILEQYIGENYEDLPYWKSLNNFKEEISKWQEELK